MDSRWWRVARGGVVAAVATLVAACSHTLAGGVAPSAFGVLASLVLSVMLATLLAGRTLSLGRLAASVGLSQVLFHALFSGLGAPVSAGHSHSSTTLQLVDAAAPHHSPAMWFAHVAAGLATLVVLRHAETAFWGVERTARLLFARLLPVVVPRPVAAVEPIVVEPRLVVLSSLRHRGPPVFA